MEQTKNKSQVLFYTLSGFGIGIVLILLAVFADMIFNSLTFIEALSLHGKHFAYILVDLSPFIIGGYLYFSSKHFLQKIEQIKSDLNAEIEKGLKVYKFIDDLKNGKKEAHYEAESEDDLLGNALVGLYDNMMRAFEDEKKRQKEDKEQQWINEGVTKFNDILRNNYSDVEEFSYMIISNLVNYINANQGGFFLLVDEKDEDRYFNMTACYAYERRKYPDKRIEWGDGLIGTCAKEKQTIYMTEVPDDYINITSGLGKETPNSLIIVPLKVEEEIHGVIELASFKEYEPYEIDFIEKAARNIAYSLSSTKVNEKTNRLLQESQEQAKELAQNEEELRQNMEELQAAKEESSRQTQEFINFTNTVNSAVLRAEFSNEGVLLLCNQKFAKVVGYNSPADLEDINISKFIDEKDKEAFSSIWNDLLNDSSNYENNMRFITRQGADIWIKATFSSMKDQDNEMLNKILFLGLEITQVQKTSIECKGQMAAYDTAMIKADFSIKNEFISGNDHFVNAFGYDTGEKLEEKKIFDFIDASERSEFVKIWNNVLEGGSYQGEMRGATKEGGEKWLRITLSPVKDNYGQIMRILLLGYDISKEKELQQEKYKIQDVVKQQNEKLEKVDKEIERAVNKTKREITQQYKEIERDKILNEQIVELIQYPVIVFDQMGIITSINKATEQAWQQSRDELTGERLRNIFSKDMIEKNDYIAKLVTPGENLNIKGKNNISFQTNKEKQLKANFSLSGITVDKEPVNVLFVNIIE
jgi:PAS domain S-box-containing protein